MSSTLALARTEIMRLRRNKRYTIFTLALPVIFYLVIAPQVKGATVAHVGYAAYEMVALAMLGAVSGSLTGNAQRIAQERKEGWPRQLRLTPLPANAYVIAKVIASMAVTVPSLIVVLLLGRFYGGVHLELWKWFAIFGVIWIGSMAFTALGIGLGYRYPPDTVQPIVMIIYFALSIFGGLWFAFSGGFLGTVGKYLPTYQLTHIGTDIIAGQSIPAIAYIVILAWLAAFVAVAIASVRASAETV
jgi:ABC-2 type transport system permease protein